MVALRIPLSHEVSRRVSCLKSSRLMQPVRWARRFCVGQTKALPTPSPSHSLPSLTMKVVSVAALLTAPAAVTGALYEIKEWGTEAVRIHLQHYNKCPSTLCAALPAIIVSHCRHRTSLSSLSSSSSFQQAPATDCSGMTNAESPGYAHTGVCSRMSKTTGMKARVAGGTLFFDAYASGTCAGTAAQTIDYGAIGSCNQVVGNSHSTFMVTPKSESQVAFEDVSVEITGAWASGDCSGTAIPLTPEEAVSVPGDCSDTIEGHGDKSKAAILVGDPGFFYDVTYPSASADNKCVGEYSSTTRYAFGVCQKIEQENADGSTTTLSFKFKKAAASSAATTTASLAVAVAAVGAAALLL